MAFPEVSWDYAYHGPAQNTRGEDRFLRGLIVLILLLIGARRTGRAAPVAWKDLRKGFDPKAFTIKTAASLPKRADPWKGLAASTFALKRARMALARLWQRPRSRFGRRGCGVRLPERSPNCARSLATTARLTAMTIKRARFVQDAKLDPGRYYRHPSDIIRDRRLNNEERLEIVIAWERDTRERLESEDSANGAAEKLSQLQKLRLELQQSAD